MKDILLERALKMLESRGNSDEINLLCGQIRRRLASDDRVGYCPVHNTHYAIGTTIPNGCPLCSIRHTLSEQAAPRTYEVAMALSSIDALEAASPEPIRPIAWAMQDRKTFITDDKKQCAGYGALLYNVPLYELPSRLMDVKKEHSDEHTR